MIKAQRQEITFREASIADRLAVARVHVESWRESFTGIVPQAFLDSMSVEKRAQAFEKGFASDCYQMFVAETQENGVVGFADFGKTRDSASSYEAELYAIYLLRNFQRQGSGARLFDLGVKHLIKSNMNSMSLLALEASPYKSFYEKMGGRVVGRKTVEMAGVEFTALVYAWDSLAES